MSELRLSVIRPSANNLAVRVFVRAAGLQFTEQDVFGQTRGAEFSARNPSHLTPMLEAPGLPRGVLWESCAIMQYLCNTHGLEEFYPRDPGRRAMIDSAMFYVTGTLYPYIARATYPRLGFPQYAGEVGHSDATPEAKEAARQAAVSALAEPLEVFHSFYLGDGGFIGGGGKPSIADIRLAASLEFLGVLDDALPGWARRYMPSVEQALGPAYAEPVADVRGYIGHVRSRQG